MNRMYVFLIQHYFYNKHIEIAHKKAVSDFDDSATIAEINDINNLIALCPNCHWEFDNGLLKL